jgi:ATP-binding cassette subfamily B protein
MGKLFARYLKPYFGLVVLVVVVTLTQVAAQLYLPKMMSDIVNVGIVQKGSTIKGSLGSDAQQIRYLLQHGSWMLGVTLVSVASAIAAGYLCSRVSAFLARDLREKVFARVEKFSLVEFDHFSTASLIIRSTNDIQQIQQMAFMLLRLALMSPCFFIVALVFAFQENAQLAWIFAVVLPLIIGLFLLVTRLVMPIFRGIQKKTDHLNLIAREGLTGVRVIRAFNRQAFQQQRFREANDDLTDANLRVFRIMVVLFPLMMFIIQVTTVAIVWFGGGLIADGGLSVGNMMAFMQYAMQVLFSLMMLSMILVMLPRASVSAERVMEVLDTRPVILDPADAQLQAEKQEGEYVHTSQSGKAGTELPLEGGAVAPADKSPQAPPLPSSPLAALEFDEVSFFYGKSEVPALSSLSFRAAQGSVLAIIGSTGAGKSTLLNLIERLYDASTGRVLLNGKDVRDYRQQELHDRIGYIPQKAVLFSGTIAENIRFGKAEASDEEVIAALTTAQAWEFVSELAQGINAPVSQGGANFSGGQKQRLAIARALIRRPEIYLFDDSFSALDLQTDAALRASLKPLLAESIQVIVAQRISTIQDADQILVLEDGRVCGLGTHRQLLAENAVYREIASSQLTEEEMAHV